MVLQTNLADGNWIANLLAHCLSLLQNLQVKHPDPQRPKTWNLFAHKLFHFDHCVLRQDILVHQMVQLEQSNYSL